MRIVTIVGARPQFVKAAPMSKALRARHEEILVHTGQHYDYDMSRVFFDGLNIPAPDINLNVGSGSHAEQTGRMLVGIAEVLVEQKPDVLLVYGDTNSTLAGAMAAAKLNIPIAHVEAGLRSYNRAMPEEINRVLTDRVSDFLFCPTQTSVDNLRRESIEQGVHLVGDVMYDVAAWAAARVSGDRKDTLAQHQIADGAFALATVHRAGNVDDLANLTAIITAFLRINRPVIWPVHPRTRQKLVNAGLMDQLTAAAHVHLLEPLGYLEFVGLLMHADMVLTDSGGIQKEACFHQTPCVTLREETEWVETVKAGWNVLAGADTDRISDAVQRVATQSRQRIEGAGLMDGLAAERICTCLESWLTTQQQRRSQAVVTPTAHRCASVTN